MRRPLTGAGIFQVATLTAVLAAGGIHEALRQTSLTSINDGDFWWHLRVGLGILQTHSLPHTGLYSQAAALPWIATSWLYDFLLAIGYRMLGLQVVLSTAIGFSFALAVLIFLLAGGLQGRFQVAVVLSLLAQYILGNLQPLPLYCSVLAFCIQLLLLSRSIRGGRSRYLYALPALFLLWANLDEQFVYGVATLLLFAASRSICSWTERLDPAASPSLKQVGVITVASLAATVATPYGWAPYATFFSKATSAANQYFPAQQSLRFRAPQDYVLLLLIMAAFLALGMRRSRDPFQISLLVLAMLLGFRTQANLWLPTVVAITILAHDFREPNPAKAERRSCQFATAVVLGGVLLLVAVVRYGPRNDKTVLARVATVFPVAAANYIREQHLPQPLFNPSSWGGFLAWYLPDYPVATDGRSDLYGSTFTIQYAQMMNAEIHYSTFAPLNQARTILLENNSLMGKALPAVPGFRVAYIDNIAVVLLRQD